MRRYDHRGVSFPTTDRYRWSDWLVLLPLIAARYIGMPIGVAVLIWTVIA